jgi:hypothetical protein
MKSEVAAAESGSMASPHGVIASLSSAVRWPLAASAPWKCGLLVLPAVGVGMRSGIVTATESTEPVTWKAGVPPSTTPVGSIETVYSTVLPSRSESAVVSPASDTVPVE